MELAGTEGNWRRAEQNVGPISRVLLDGTVDLQRDLRPELNCFPRESLGREPAFVAGRETEPAF